MISNFFLESLPKPAKLSTSTLQELIGYSWPGNVRELRNILEQSSILSENSIIELHHLPEALFKQNSQNEVNLRDDMALDAKLELMEKEIIIAALRKTRGIQIKAADVLGINQRSLWHRIKKYNIEINTFRNLQ